MKIVIIVVGKKHDPLFATAIDTYVKRLARNIQLEWQFIPSPKAALSMAEQKKQESVLLFSALKPRDTVLLLDERGHQWSSPELATQLHAWQQNIPGRLVIMIGGAYGVGDELRTRADHLWSLSKLIFPHQLVRLILVEQLYRAFSILRGEPYHHQ